MRLQTAQPTKRDAAQARPSQGQLLPTALSFGPHSVPVSLLELQRTIGNRATGRLLEMGGDGQRRAALSDATMPHHERPVPAPGQRSAGGRPIDDDTRSFMEARFGADFDHVRIHTDTRAAASARRMGAQAYTLGSSIFFGAGRYRPTTEDGTRLLAHELAHVVEQGGQGGHEASEPRLKLDTTLPTHVERLQALAEEVSGLGLSDDEIVGLIFRTIGAVDLEDRDNLGPISDVVATNFSSEVLLRFLARAEQVVETKRAERTVGEEGQADVGEPEMPPTVRPRDPSEQRGPDVLPTPIGGPALDLTPTVKLLDDLFANAGQYVVGLWEGYGEATTPEQHRLLAERLIQNQVLQAVFPTPFLVGTAVGIGEDFGESVRGLYDTVVNIDEVVAATTELVSAMFTPAGAELARKMGHETGSEYAEQVTALLGTGMFRFSYDLGRLIGPTMVYVVLSFIGLPVLVVACVRLARVLAPYLRRIPGVTRLLEAVSSRLPGTWLPGDRRLPANRQLPDQRRAPGQRQVPGERQVPDDRRLPGEGGPNPPTPVNPLEFTREQMWVFLQRVWNQNYAILQRIRHAGTLTGDQRRLECLDILEEFMIDSRRYMGEPGMQVQVVPDGYVQRLKNDRRDTASIRTREGFLQIEQSTYNDPDLLYGIVLHDVVFFYAGGPGRIPRIPGLGELGFAHVMLEEMIVENGARPVFTYTRALIDRLQE